MVNPSMDFFTIEPRHLVDGLTASDFTAIVGARVKVVRLDEHPHWDKVAQGVSLTAEEKKERIRSIHEVLPAARLRPATNLDSFPFGASKRFDIEQTIASDTTPSLHTIYKAIRHFPSITRQLVKLRNGTEDKTKFFDDKTNRTFVYPYSFKPKNNITQIVIPEASTVFLPPMSVSSRATWSHLTNLPENVITRCPQDRYAHVLGQLHEAQHGVQLLLPTLGKFKGYDREYGADLFALRSATQDSQGQEAKKAWVHARYLNILYCSQNYWFAPYLEADLQKGVPPQQDAVKEACREIRRHFYIAHRGIVGRAILNMMPALVDDFYADWSKTHIVKKPEISYPHFRKITEQGVFKKNPLAQDIAHRILGAAEYFSPGLTTIQVRAPS